MKTLTALLAFFAFGAFAQGPILRTPYTVNPANVVTNIVREIATNSTIHAEKLRAGGTLPALNGSGLTLSSNLTAAQVTLPPGGNKRVGITNGNNGMTLVQFSSGENEEMIEFLLGNTLTFSVTTTGIVAYGVEYYGSGGNIGLNASGFNGNLTTSDDTLQKVAQKLDDLVASGSDSTKVLKAGDTMTGNLEITNAGIRIVGVSNNSARIFDSPTKSPYSTNGGWSLSQSAYENDTSLPWNDVLRLSYNMDAAGNLLNTNIAGVGFWLEPTYNVNGANKLVEPHIFLVKTTDGVEHRLLDGQFNTGNLASSFGWSFIGNSHLSGTATFQDFYETNVFGVWETWAGGGSIESFYGALQLKLFSHDGSATGGILDFFSDTTNVYTREQMTGTNLVLTLGGAANPTDGTVRLNGFTKLAVDGGILTLTNPASGLGNFRAGTLTNGGFVVANDANAWPVIIGGAPGAESGYGALWVGVDPTTANYSILNGGGNLYLNAPAAGQMLLRVGNTTYATLDASTLYSAVNVGIKTNNPQAELHVVGNSLTSGTNTAATFSVGGGTIDSWDDVTNYFTISGGSFDLAADHVFTGSNSFPALTTFKLYDSAATPVARVQFETTSTKVNAEDGTTILEGNGAGGDTTISGPGAASTTQLHVSLNKIWAADGSTVFHGNGGGFSNITAAAVGGGSVSDVEFGRLDGVTDPIQSQLVWVTNAGNLAFLTAGASNNFMATVNFSGPLQITWSSNVAAVDWTKPAGFIRTNADFTLVASGTPYAGSQFDLTTTNNSLANKTMTLPWSAFSPATNTTISSLTLWAGSEQKFRFSYDGALYRVVETAGPNNTNLVGWAAITPITPQPASATLSNLSNLNGSGLTNVPITGIASVTNTLGGAVVDYSKAEATTNMAGALTFTGISNFNATNYNTFVLHCLANGADRTVTPASGWGKSRGTFVVTNGTRADIIITTQVGLFTNMAQVDFF